MAKAHDGFGLHTQAIAQAHAIANANSRAALQALNARCGWSTLPQHSAPSTEGSCSALTRETLDGLLGSITQAQAKMQSMATALGSQRRPCSST